MIVGSGNASGDKTNTIHKGDGKTMKLFKVYGARDGYKEFDTLNEAMIYAKKYLRNNGFSHRIRSTVYHKDLFVVSKVNNEFIIKDLRK